MTLQVRPSMSLEDFAEQYRLPLDDPRTREMYSESLEAGAELALLDVPSCPPWCMLPPGHAYDDMPWAGPPAEPWTFTRQHERQCGVVRVYQVEENDGSTVTFWPPGADTDDLTDGDVRQTLTSGNGLRSLIPDISHAADLLDEIAAGQR